MNLSKTAISIAVASMVGAAGYAVAQQTGATQSDTTYKAGTNNPNIPRATVSGSGADAGVSSSTTDSSGRVVEATGTTDSGSRMNSDRMMRDRTTGQSSGSMAGEPLARADRN